MNTTAGLEPARSSLRRDVPGRAARRARRGVGEAAARRRRGGGGTAADDLACVYRLSAHARTQVHGGNGSEHWASVVSIRVTSITAIYD